MNPSFISGRIGKVCQRETVEPLEFSGVQNSFLRTMKTNVKASVVLCLIGGTQMEQERKQIPRSDTRKHHLREGKDAFITEKTLLFSGWV